MTFFFFFKYKSLVDDLELYGINELDPSLSTHSGIEICICSICSRNSIIFLAFYFLVFLNILEAIICFLFFDIWKYLRNLAKFYRKLFSRQWSSSPCKYLVVQLYAGWLCYYWTRSKPVKLLILPYLKIMHRSSVTDGIIKKNYNNKISIFKKYSYQISSWWRFENSHWTVCNSRV